VRTFHANWAYVVVSVNLLTGLWGLLFVRRRLPAPAAFWPVVGAGYAALAVQVVLGLALTRTLGNPPGIHMFYGFVVAIAAILVFAFRSEDAKHNVTYFAAVSLFVGAVSIRAMITV